MKRITLLACLTACGPEKSMTESADPSTSSTDPTTSSPTTSSPTTTATEPDTSTSTTSATSTTTDTTTDPGPTTGDTADQVPPITGKADMRPWLASGHYKQWNCQPAAHDPLPISPHGKNRICSNDALSGHGKGEYPVDAAAVKELYDADGLNVVGYAVSRHVTAGTEGSDWYWYEEVPLDSPAPHDADGIVADGLGDSGPAQSICVGCHQATGLDADHPGHDFVYIQVQ